MYNGDQPRKETLVEHGFRLPVALDNRPLRFDEFEERLEPGGLRLGHARALRAGASTGGEVVEQVIRPTGLVDPEIDVQPDRGAGRRPDAARSASASRRSERVLVTTLTKRMAEDLTDYLQRAGRQGATTCTREIDTIERVEILRDLRQGDFDVLVGINLLREGLDLPEVSLVAILDADKEGFLRCETSLIQTIGRAARNVERQGDHVRRQR